VWRHRTSQRSSGWLRVRGRGAVFRTILLKVTGWNVLLAAASEKLVAMIQDKLTQMLGAGWARPFRQPRVVTPRPPAESPRPKRLPTDSGLRFHAPQNHFNFLSHSPPDSCRTRQLCEFPHFS